MKILKMETVVSWLFSTTAIGNKICISYDFSSSLEFLGNDSPPRLLLESTKKWVHIAIQTTENDDVQENSIFLRIYLDTKVCYYCFQMIHSSSSGIHDFPEYHVRNLLQFMHGMNINGGVSNLKWGRPFTRILNQRTALSLH